MEEEASSVKKAKLTSHWAVVEHDGVQMRVVAPYLYEFRLKYRQRRKQRMTLQQFYEREVGVGANATLDEEDLYYLQKSLECGLVTVNGKICSADYELKNGDIIHRKWHRHEASVASVPIEQMIVAETEDFLVCNKPSTIPVHAGGYFRLNSFKYIIESARPELGELFPVHRLDRLTSGLLLLAKSSTGARKISQYIQNQQALCMRKNYVAKVIGKFPASVEEGSALRGVVLRTEQASSSFKTNPHQNQVSSTWFVVDIPILDTKKQGEEAGEGKDGGGRESLSRFRLIGYDPTTNTSLVKCEPVTGRTHQLRIHLQSLGFPIGNDPEYGGTIGVVPPEVTEKDSDEFSSKCADALVTKVNTQEQTRESSSEDSLARSICPECTKHKHAFKPIGHPGIWLHAYRVRFYDGDNLEHDFRVGLPKWAIDPYLTQGKMGI